MFTYVYHLSTGDSDFAGPSAAVFRLDSRPAEMISRDHLVRSLERSGEWKILDLKNNTNYKN